VSTAPKHEYAYREASASWAYSYLVPPLLSEIERLKPTRAFEIGAGSGHVASLLAKRGIEVTAIEPSESGVALARRHHPNVKMHAGSVYDDLAKTYGRFPLVLSLEVVEHLMYPRLFAKAVFDLLEAGGTAIVSTPYHGYLKNLALALTARWMRISLRCGMADTSNFGRSQRSLRSWKRRVCESNASFALGVYPCWRNR
jgi:2-polyprenyl-3-methyl-5-hydroxy-6-metoxy-1,4-benzoquinol methylase